MSFDLNAVPASERSKTHIAAHVEMYNKSMDTVRIHNPTNEDYTIFNDKKFSNERWVVPHQGKDVGFGYGNLDVPRYIADRFINKMGTEMIRKISREKWEKDKKKYRLEERGMMEQQLAIKINDKQQWDKIVPVMFVGVVKKHQEANYEEEIEQERPEPTFSKAEASLQRLGLTDEQIDIAKQKVTKQAQE